MIGKDAIQSMESTNVKVKAQRLARVIVSSALLSATAAALATETENFGLQILPTPRTVTIDGRSDDWDLSGGIFVCGDVENTRETLSLSIASNSTSWAGFTRENVFFGNATAPNNHRLLD
jgi:hypothetical protein